MSQGEIQYSKYSFPPPAHRSSSNSLFAHDAPPPHDPYSGKENHFPGHLLLFLSLPGRNAPPPPMRILYCFIRRGPKAGSFGLEHPRATALPMCRNSSMPLIQSLLSFL